MAARPAALRLLYMTHDDDSDWQVTSGPTATKPSEGVAWTPRSSGMAPCRDRSPVARAQGHPDILVSWAASPLVVVAVGDREYLGDRRRAMGLGYRYRRDVDGQLSHRTGRGAASLRPGSRVFRRLP